MEFLPCVFALIDLPGKLRHGACDFFELAPMFLILGDFLERGLPHFLKTGRVGDSLIGANLNYAHRFDLVADERDGLQIVLVHVGHVCAGL